MHVEIYIDTKSELICIYYLPFVNRIVYFCVYMYYAWNWKVGEAIHNGKRGIMGMSISLFVKSEGERLVQVCLSCLKKRRVGKRGPWGRPAAFDDWALPALLMCFQFQLNTLHPINLPRQTQLVNYNFNLLKIIQHICISHHQRCHTAISL